MLPKNSFFSGSKPARLLLLSALALAAIVASPCAMAMSNNQQQETLWAEQLKAQPLSGESLSLPTADGEIFAIHTLNQSKQRKGALVLLHDKGGHPDWPSVIHPLRIGLAQLGWDSISVQLPIPANDNLTHEEKTALLETSRARIDAALSHLKKGRPEAVGIIGHGLGSLMAADYIGKKFGGRPPPTIQGVVLISITSDNDKESPFYSPALVEKTDLPVLDIYGGEDLLNVIRYAPERNQAAFRHPMSDYRQVEITGANHFFAGMDDSLLYYIRSWLERMVLNKNPLATQ